MLYIAEAVDKEGHRILGSDGSIKINLKTIRGVDNRIERFNWNPRTYKINVYLVPSGPYFSESKKKFKYSILW